MPSGLQHWSFHLSLVPPFYFSSKKASIFSSHRYRIAKRGDIFLYLPAIFYIISITPLPIEAAYSAASYLGKAICFVIPNLELCCEDVTMIFNVWVS